VDDFAVMQMLHAPRYIQGAANDDRLHVWELPFVAFLQVGEEGQLAGVEA
jgi:hypothetical protein